jgi:hypothetical protein
MATNAFIARLEMVEDLTRASDRWDFRWSEYQAARREADRFRTEAVQPADARISEALASYVPNPAASAAVMARDLVRLRAEAAPDYELIQYAYAELVDEACSIEHMLMQTPAPDQAALLWKIEHLLGVGAACAEARQSVTADARRLLASAA